MNKLLAVLIASTFAVGSASVFAADAGTKKEQLTTEQKMEIRDRVERLKSERAKTETAKPTEPAKTSTPKRTSGTTKAVKPGKALPKVAKATTATPAAGAKVAKPKA